MLTMPVATCSVLVASRMGSTQASSAGGEPPTQTAPYPRDSISLACWGVTPRPNDPNRPRLGLPAAESVMLSPTGGVGALFRQRDIDGGRYLQRQQHDEPRIARHGFHPQIAAMFLDDDVE